MTIGHVLHAGEIRNHVALPPRFLKGKRGNDRSVPIGPELRRALELHLARRTPRQQLRPDDPLFLSQHLRTTVKGLAKDVFMTLEGGRAEGTDWL